MALAKHRPRGTGFVNPNAPLVAARTQSGCLAVLAIHTFDSTGVTVHVRTRRADQGGTGVGADGGSAQEFFKTIWRITFPASR